MTAYALYDYQQESLSNARYDWFHGLLRLVVLLPTGTGKAVIAAHAAARERGQTVFIAHRHELLDQFVEKLRDVAPNKRIGMLADGEFGPDYDVVVAMIQTASRPKRLLQLGTPSLIIVDEAHHACARTYVETLTALGGFDKTRVLGLTATLSRNDELGLGDVWQKVTLKRTIAWCVKRGYIVPARTVDVRVPNLDLRTVKHSDDGDYDEAALDVALVNARAGRTLAKAYLRHAARKRGIIFCPRVGSAHAISKDFTDAGLSNAVIDGSMSKAERQAIYDAAKRSEIQVLITCMVLTEGFDDTGIEVVVVARRVRLNPDGTARSLYIQMVGRGTRPAKFKRECIVLNPIGDEVPMVTKADLRKTPGKAGVNRRASTATPLLPPRPAAPRPVYAATQTGKVVTVTKDGVVLMRKTLKDAADGPRLARLLIEVDRRKAA